MKFYSIWAKPFSRGLKIQKKKVLKLRNMGPKKAIKIINIHKNALKFKLQ